MTDRKRKVIPLDLPPDLSDQIDEAASRLNMPKSEAMRLALKTGLAALQKIEFDVGGALANAADVGHIGQNQASGDDAKDSGDSAESDGKE